MKKTWIVLAIAASVALVSCGPSQPASSTTAPVAGTPTVKYMDGTYKVTYDHFDSRGWKPFIEILVKESMVVSANHDYVNAKGEFKSEDKAYADGMKNKTGLTPLLASQGLIDQLVDKNSAEIDGVTGATGTTTLFKEMARVGLAAAVKGDISPILLPMNDIYRAKDQADDRGYVGEIAIAFKDGKIAEVIFDEKNKEGKAKRDDADYNKNMKAKTQVSWTEAAQKLAQSLIAKQDPTAIDAVAGATASGDRFKKLALQALSVR